MMADDLGLGDPSYVSMTVSNHPDRGWIQTPNLDAMAANGLRFDRFYASSPVCSPTRGSCLTGRNPFRLGIPNANAGRLEWNGVKNEITLAEVLASAGYRTAHFGKWQLGSLTTLREDAVRGAPGATSVYSGPWQNGFDTCYTTEKAVPTYHPYRNPVNNLPLPVSYEDPNFYGTRYWRVPTDTNTWFNISGEGDPVPVNEVNNPVNGDDSLFMMDKTIDFIRDAVSEGKPFFALVWFHTPHTDLVDPAQSAAVNSSTALKAAVEDMDLQVGRLRSELAALGVRDNTMVWFCSDNGPISQNSPSGTKPYGDIRTALLRGRKQSMWEGGTRVPGILEWPARIAPGQSTDFPAVVSDYYPTILDYLQIPLPAGQKPLDGISLRPAIEGTATERTRPIGFLFRNTGNRSWVTQRYKLVSSDLSGGTGGNYELYDLLNDPRETTNIAASNPALTTQLIADLEAWMAAVSNDTVYPPDPWQTDTDGDGLVDAVETGTGIFVSLKNTGTRPDLPDSDGDGFSDYDEVVRYQTDPNSTADFPVIGSVVDSDGDGLPDWWERKHFGNLTATDGSGDADFDGLTDYEEYVIGSNPRVADAAGLQLRLSDEIIGLSWTSVPGRSYRLEKSGDLNAWMPASPLLKGNGLEISLEAPASGLEPQGFIRQRITLEP